MADLRNRAGVQRHGRGVFLAGVRRLRQRADPVAGRPLLSPLLPGRVHRPGDAGAPSRGSFRSCPMARRGDRGDRVGIADRRARVRSDRTRRKFGLDRRDRHELRLSRRRPDPAGGRGRRLRPGQLAAGAGLAAARARPRSERRGRHQLPLHERQRHLRGGRIDRLDVARRRPGDRRRGLATDSAAPHQAAREGEKDARDPGHVCVHGAGRRAVRRRAPRLSRGDRAGGRHAAAGDRPRRAGRLPTTRGC